MALVETLWSYGAPTRVAVCLRFELAQETDPVTSSIIILDSDLAPKLVRMSFSNDGTWPASANSSLQRYSASGRGTHMVPIAAIYGLF